MNEMVNSKVDFVALEEILKSFDYKKSYLIAMLQKVQAIYKYLPEEAMTYIGEHVDGLSPATVFGVATFYAQFSLEPKGKYEIKVCDGTACHVRGSSPVYQSLVARFGVTIFFGRPNKKEFQQIVKVLAERSDIKMSEEELFLEANKWELSHGGLSGRTAQQFVDYLLGKPENN